MPGGSMSSRFLAAVNARGRSVRQVGGSKDAPCCARVWSGTKQIVQRLVASALVELWRAELAIRLGLRAAHEEAFLDDLTVPDRVKPDLIEVHAFLALWRDL